MIPRKGYAYSRPNLRPLSGTYQARDVIDWTLRDNPLEPPRLPGTSHWGK
jgi:hypothetical protein